MGWIFIAIGIIYAVIQITTPIKERKRVLEQPFPISWKQFLNKKVSFYRHLSETEKNIFERKIKLFLYDVTITGVQTNITDEDRLLVASSAVIPVFYFDHWRYRNLKVVLIYPGAVKTLKRHRKVIIGMVGKGKYAGKMFLSKPALHRGFEYELDGKNVGIHEFVHLIDMADGVADGIPKKILKHQYTIPWIRLIHKKIDQIDNNLSDIKEYGATNTVEFFSVASEYFFENPEKMQQNHPKLYNMLSKIFMRNKIQ